MTIEAFASTHKIQNETQWCWYRKGEHYRLFKILKKHILGIGLEGLPDIEIFRNENDYLKMQLGILNSAGIWKEREKESFVK